MGVISGTGQKLKGGTGGLLSEVFSQAVTPIGTVGGQAVYRLGKGIEFIGNLGAKNLGEALGIQGGLKFPGDKAVDDIGKRVQQIKSTPNKQGGFVRVLQEAKAPIKTQVSQTANKVNKTVISPKSTTKPKIDNPLAQEARKYKSAESPLYHGSPQEIKNNTLTYGMKKGQDSGGIFLTDTKQSAETFAFGGKVYEISPAIKAKTIDLTQSKNINLFKKEIGKTYTTFDGEKIKFTQQDFDLMFPNGKTDFASISQYPELVQKVVDQNKMRGIAFNEYAGGKVGKTYQILNGDVPLKK
jgi:hypothetical protein